MFSRCSILHCLWMDTVHLCRSHFLFSFVSSPASVVCRELMNCMAIVDTPPLHPPLPHPDIRSILAQVSIADDVPEEERAKGFLCTAERFARRMTGRQDAEYGLSITNGQLVLGSGRFCREFTTPVSGGVADRLGVGKRGGGIRHAHGAFDVVGNFQAISSRGEVLWSTAGSAGKGGDSGGGDGGWWRFGAKGKSGAEGPEETNHGMGVAGGGEGRVDGGSWWRPGGNTGPHR